jgi:hypothetical protein
MQLLLLQVFQVHQTLLLLLQIRKIIYIMSFLEELAKKGLISTNQISDVKARAEQKYNGDLDKALIEGGVAEEKNS